MDSEDILKKLDELTSKKKDKKTSFFDLLDCLEKVKKDCE